MEQEHKICISADMMKRIEEEILPGEDVEQFLNRKIDANIFWGNRE